MIDRESQVPQRDNTNEHISADFTSEDTAAFRADLFGSDPRVPGAGLGAEELASGWPVLVVKRGPNTGARFAIRQPVTSAGRSPDSDIFLDDVTVSRLHAEFRRQDGKYQLVDLGSLNGTYVNREPVGSVVLNDGDEIQIGKFRLVFLRRPATA